MAGRKIRDEREARRCMAAAKSSGLSRTEWARRQGIDGRSMFAWARNLERGDRGRRGQQKTKGGMVELIPATIPAVSRYVVRCGQVAIELDDCFEEATLARLLKVVGAC